MKKKKLLPPTYLKIYLLLAIGLHFIIPIIKLIKPPFSFIGFLLIGLGVWLNLWADKLFKEKKTTVKPYFDPSALILTGPFRFSRHPMYLGMVIALAGIAMVLGSLTAFFAPLAFLVTMEIVFIPTEEKAIENIFGQEYRDYKKRVRRWL
jgi:protein-S-isoprenylcysteine O-methyltransferase Ste14